MAIDPAVQPGAFTGACASTGERIPPGARFVAAIVERAGDHGELELVRADFCLNAWGRDPRPAGLVACWHSTAPSPDDRRTRFVDDQTLLDVLARLGESTEPRHAAYRWVLALLLLRRKVLRQESVRRDEAGASWWSFRVRGEEDGAAFEIRDPHLRDEDVADLADQLGEVIATGGG